MTAQGTLSAIFLAFVFAACGSPGEPAGSVGPVDSATTVPADTTVASSVSATPIAEQAPATLYGVAGLIPPHWPRASDADWAALFASYSETGSLIGVYQGWESAKQPVAVAFQVAGQQGLTPVVAIGIKVDAGSGVEIPIDLADPAVRKAFVDSAVGLVEEHDIRYLMIDTEVDRTEAEDPVAFEGVVSLYSETYDAVKAASPQTLVFTGFQLEMLRGAASLTGREWEARWDLVDRFGDRLDLVAFTTYPFLEYASPSDIPDGYYAEAAERAGGRPIAFTEIGWPSAPLASAPASEYGGSPEEQAAFVRRFAELTAGLDVRLALWALPYDLGEAGPDPFRSVALRENNGTPKAALAEWAHLAGE